MSRSLNSWFAVLIAVSTALVHAQTISTVAGGGPNNVPALSAKVYDPQAVLVDPAGNIYYVAGILGRVMRIAPDGTLTVYAGNGSTGFTGDGGDATQAAFGNFQTMALDPT